MSNKKPAEAGLFIIIVVIEVDGLNPSPPCVPRAPVISFMPGLKCDRIPKLVCRDFHIFFVIDIEKNN